MRALPFVFLLWLLVILNCVAPSDRRTNSANSSSSSPELELLSFHGEREYSFLIVNGQVKNISGNKMEGVWAVVEFYDSQGRLVTSEDGVIEYNPLMPEQTSPFKVMQRDNPLISTFKVKFKYTFGTPISYKDSTPPNETPAKRKR